MKIIAKWGGGGGLGYCGKYEVRSTNMRNDLQPFRVLGTLPSMSGELTSVGTLI